MSGSPLPALTEDERQVYLEALESPRLDGTALAALASRVLNHQHLVACESGLACFKLGRFEEAIGHYYQVLQTDPTHRAALINLAQVLRRTQKYQAAITVLNHLLRLEPDNLHALGQLGFVYAASGQNDQAFACLHRVIARNPDHAEALHAIANIQMLRGDRAGAMQHYARSHALKPLITLPGILAPPAFHVLLLFAPGGGNTPFHCMLDNARYDSHLLNILPGVAYTIGDIRRHADVVVNLIADGDQSHEALLLAAELIDQIGKPTLNHPRAVLASDRETIGQVLRGIPGCSVPAIRRYRGAWLAQGGGRLDATPFAFPVLVRPAGTHGGVHFEKIPDAKGLHAFLARQGEGDYYLSTYVDYRSADGFFRKYRFIFVGTQILPYHLAIGQHWKVHHASTDMANQPWMQAEEQAFLESPHTVFSAQHYTVLDAIRQKVGLDYCGIDCALDGEGNILVFEVNACMLVHHFNPHFPYKAPAIQRIKEVLHTLLEKSHNA